MAPKRCLKREARTLYRRQRSAAPLSVTSVILQANRPVARLSPIAEWSSLQILFPLRVAMWPSDLKMCKVKLRPPGDTGKFRNGFVSKVRTDPEGFQDLLVEATSRKASGRSFAGVVYAHQLRVTIGGCIHDLEIIAKAGQDF